MKIFQINDCDWYTGPNIYEVIQCVMRETGDTFEDSFTDDLHELTEEELDYLTFTEDAVDPDTMEPIQKTFRKKLTEMIAAGDTRTGMFASTEF